MAILFGEEELQLIMGDFFYGGDFFKEKRKIESKKEYSIILPDVLSLKLRVRICGQGRCLSCVVSQPQSEVFLQPREEV